MLLLISLNNYAILHKTDRNGYSGFMSKNKNLAEMAFVTLAVIVAISLLTLKVKAGEDFDLSQATANLQIIEQTFLLPLAKPPAPQVASRMNVIVTAYSSTVGETDDTPFTTASGEPVADGVIANNYFPFGTLIRLPELFGDKIFVVKDRMHWKKGNYHFDVWFASRNEALTFGAKNTRIEILQ